MRMYCYNLLRTLRERMDLFWTLAFPLILGTLFYVSFGNGSLDIERMEAIPVCLVSEGNQIFETILNELDGTMLNVTVSHEEEALEALKNGEVKGIFYSGNEPSLTVSGRKLQESILETLLDSYSSARSMFEEIARNHPLKLPAAIWETMQERELVEVQSVGGNQVNDSLSYFFALVSMTCLFGSFSGLRAAIELRADQSALAQRRSAAPVHRLKLVISEMFSVFTIQFANCCILLLYLHFALKISFGEQWILLLPVCALGSICGVSTGILLGCLPLKTGPKEGIAVALSLTESFLAGLMVGNMKNTVEHFCPLINRINPAALIADAFYSISVYDNPGRYQRNLLLLSVITILLLAGSYWRLRRERYDSL